MKYSFKRFEIIFEIIIIMVMITIISCTTLKTSDARFILKHNERITAVSYNQAENKLAALGRDGIITLWDMNNGGMINRIVTNNTGKVESLIYSEEGVIVIYKNTDIMLYDPSNSIGTNVRNIPMGIVEKFVYSPEGRRLIFGIATDLSWGRINEWEVIDRKLVSIDFSLNQNVKEIILPTTEFRAVKHAPFGSISPSMISDNDSDNMASQMVDDIQRRQEEREHEQWLNVEYQKRRYEITSIAISSDEIIACGFFNGYIYIYDGKTGKFLYSFQNGGSTTALAFSSDGRYLLSGSYETVRLWDTKNGWEKITERNFKSSIASLFFSPDNNSFISKRGNIFSVIDIRNGNIINTINGSRSTSVFYERNNEILIIEIKNQSVFVWKEII